MRIIISILSLLACYSLKGQQQNHFTQFARTQLYYNPAVAGTNDYLDLTGRHRNQWAGLEGAPQGTALIANFPTILNNTGIGLAIGQNTIGVQSKTDISGMYAYHLRLTNATLSLGLQVSFRQFINDFTDARLIAIDGFELDPSIDRIKYTDGYFNVGIGTFLNAEKYYLGLSIPRTLRSAIDLGQNSLAREVQHFYAMFGLRFMLNEEWKVQPHLLYKYALQAPFDLDLQTNFIYRDQVHLGVNFRTGGTNNSIMESSAVLLGFQFTPKIFASLSYDFNTTVLRNYEEGSFEFLVSYQFTKDKTPKVIHNPRYF